MSDEISLDEKSYREDTMTCTVATLEYNGEKVKMETISSGVGGGESGDSGTCGRDTRSLGGGGGCTVGREGGYQERDVCMDDDNAVIVDRDPFHWHDNVKVYFI